MNAPPFSVRPAGRGRPIRVLGMDIEVTMPAEGATRTKVEVYLSRRYGLEMKALVGTMCRWTVYDGNLRVAGLFMLTMLEGKPPHQNLMVRLETEEAIRWQCIR